MIAEAVLVVFLLEVLVGLGLKKIFGFLAEFFAAGDGFEVKFDLLFFVFFL